MNEYQQANAIAAQLRAGRRPVRDELPARTREVLAFMRKFLAEQDQLPPMLAISRHFGWGTAGAAQWHLERLENRGVIERNAVGKYRFSRTTQ